MSYIEKENLVVGAVAESTGLGSKLLSFKTY
jgi:hypothetical protein